MAKRNGIAPRYFKLESLLFLNVITPSVPMTIVAEKLAVAEKHIRFIFFKVVLNNSERRFLFLF